MGTHIKTALKYALIAVLSLPVAGCFTFDANLVPFLDQLGNVFFLAVWVLLVYWASRASTNQEVAAKICRAFALAAFLLPVASIVSVITDPSDEHRVIPNEVFINICLILGGVMGLLGWAASLLLSRDRGKAAEKDSF